MDFEGKKQAIFFVLFCVLSNSCAGADERMRHNSSMIGEEVPVGVILDMGSKEGKILLSCISMALSDFYHLHSNYTTRVVLHSRDSNGKPLHSLSAARNLLENIKVEAIIGAQTRMEANLLAEIGEDAEIPVMTLSHPIPSPPLTDRYRFLVEVTQDETTQVRGISAVVEMFEWKNVGLLYEGRKYSNDIIPYLINSFQEQNVDIAYKASISPSSADQQISEELLKLMTLQTTVFVVHMSHLLVSRLFLIAEKLGMMKEGYAWIVTSSSMNLLHSMDSLAIESMQGVLGLKSYIPSSISLSTLTSRMRRKSYLEEVNLEVRELSADAIWAYDATWALAGAVERSRTSPPNSSIAWKQDIGLIGTNASNTRSSRRVAGLVAEIFQSRFKGLSGEMEYRNGKLVSRGFEIVNVIGKGERSVGFWLGEEANNIKESHLLKRRNLVSTNTVIWPGGSSTIPKGSKMQLPEIKLRILVPLKTGFKELVRVDYDLQTNKTHVTGFCIDVFETAVSRLPYKVYYEFFPFENPRGHIAGSYDELVYQVFLKKYDAVVGDTTITSNRSNFVDFTIPYTDVGVAMLVPKEKDNMWIFLKPLSADLWLTTAGFFILTGVVVWVIERSDNTEFQGSPSEQIGMIFWFSFSTLVFSHREKLVNNLARFVMIIWVFVVLILTSSYTANLASMMTVKQIQLSSTGSDVGYLINFPGFKRYRTVEQFADALSRGSKHGGVSAIIDEIPYINIFLANYSSDYSMVKPKSTTNGFGFVFPKGSNLVHDISMQIEILREQGKLTQMGKDWFRREAEDTISDQIPNVLSVKSFGGLFLVSGACSTFALFLFLIFSLKGKWHVAKRHILRYLIRGRQRVRKLLSNRVSSVNEQISTSTEMVVFSG